MKAPRTTALSRRLGEFAFKSLSVPTFDKLVLQYCEGILVWVIAKSSPTIFGKEKQVKGSIHFE
jgi:hypothetical protein